MKRLLLVFVSAMVVVAVAGVGAGILAFTPAAPSALAALSRLDSVSSAAAAPAVVKAASPVLQIAAGGDLQSQLTGLYAKVNPSVVNIRVTLGGVQPTANPGQGQSPNRRFRRAPNGQTSPNGQGGLQDLLPGLQNLLPGLQNLFPGLQNMLPGLQNLLPGLPNLNNQGTPNGQGNQTSPNGQGGLQDLLPGLPNAPTGAEGSGFVWNTQGHIVTNNHVVAGATKIEVTFADGRTVSATLVGTDPDSDLAVIQVDPKGLSLQPLALADSSQVQVGQFVAAIGNPFGLEGSMSFGIVSALGRSLPAGSESQAAPGGPAYAIPDLIQTDAPINPGYSGGVLLNLDGQLIGVPTAIDSPVRGSAGVGLCIPSNTVKQIVPVLIAHRQVQHPYLGISGTTLNPGLAQAMGLDAAQRGALVESVAAGGPAAQAGLQASNQSATVDGQSVKVGGDVIVKINNQAVNTMEDIISYLARSTQVGQTVTLTVLRNGQQTTVTVTLAARPGQTTSQAQPSAPKAQPMPRTRPTPKALPAPAQAPAYLGVQVVTLSPELAQAMHMANGQRGALVEAIGPATPAEQAGLQASTQAFTAQDGQDILVGGDVVTAVNGQNVSSAQDLTRAIQAAKPGQQFRLSILRQGRPQDVTVTLAVRPTTTD
jgi:S1-C subfamily serine protease